MAKNKGKKPPRPRPSLDELAAARPTLPPAPYHCPWGQWNCRKPEYHEKNHPDVLKFVETASPYSLEYFMQSSSMSWGYYGDNRKTRNQVFDTVLSRPDRNPALECALIKGLGKRDVPLDVERLLDDPHLSHLALRELSKRKDFTPEAVLAFLDQPHLREPEIFALMTNLQRAPRLQEIREAFSTSYPLVRAGLAILDVKSSWEPGELLRTTRITMNLLNRNRESGLETLEVLGREWEGSIHELGETVRLLM